MSDEAVNGVWMVCCIQQHGVQNWKVSGGPIDQAEGCHKESMTGQEAPAGHCSEVVPVQGLAVSGYRSSGNSPLRGRQDVCLGGRTPKSKVSPQTALVQEGGCPFFMVGR